MGLVVVGFGLLDISLWYLILAKVVYTARHMSEGLQLFGLTLVPAGMSIAWSGRSTGWSPVSAMAGWWTRI